jgi:hypothetical protein
MTINNISSCCAQTNAAGQTTPKVSGQKTTVAPKQVSAKKAERNDQAAAQESGALDPRLASYARNVDSRMKLAIEKAAESPREQAALEAAQKHFHSMVFRMNDAFLTPGKQKSEMAPGEGMQKVLDHLTGAVQTVLTHGKIDVQG